MSAKWLYPVRGIALKGSNMPLGPIFFVFGKTDVHDIPRDGILDEDDLTVGPGDRLAFGGIIFYEYTG